MKIEADIRISVNSGAALVLFLAAFFGLLGLVAASARVAAVFAIALGGLTLGFGGYLKKRDSNNAKALDLEKAKLACDPGKGMGQG